jgi:serine/threonine protein kinase
MPKKQLDQLLGQGSFGCVVQPRLPCPTKEELFPSKMKKVPRSKQVSKIFTNVSDFQMEMEKSAMAATADPTGRRLLLPTSSCETNRRYVENHSNAIHECDAMMESVYRESKKLYQMNMPYGGTRVDKYLKTANKSRREFLEDLLPVFEGILELAKKSICHQDIKPSNMLYTSIRKIILIDYSLMVPTKDVYKERNLKVLRHSYMPYPPEYKMFYLFYRNQCLKNKPCPYLKEVYETFISFGGDRYESFLNFHEEETIQKQLKSLYEWTLKHKDHLEDAFAGFADKVDPYSVGMCMVMVDRYLDKTRDSGEFHERYENLVKSLTMIDPRKRPDAVKALHHVQKLLKKK